MVFFGRRFAQMQYYLSALVAGAVVLSFWEIGYGPYVFVALLPVVYALILGGRLSVADGAMDFLEALKGSAKVLAAYGVLLSAGVLLGAVLA